MNLQKSTVHIIGAGFSGLTVGYLLSKSGSFDISIFEKNDQVGGLIHTRKDQDFLIETAANSILCDSQVLKLLDEVDADYVRPLPTAKNRFFFRHKLTRWPLNFLETITLIPKVMFHMITRRKFIKLDDSISVMGWVQKYFGKSFAKYFLSPALQGIYAAPADQLNAELVLGPLLLKKKKEKYQGIVSGRQGMQSIIEAFKQKCLQNGVKIFTGHAYDFSETANATIICTSAPDAALTLPPQYSNLIQSLQKIQMTSVLSVTCRLPSGQRPKGFGCLVPSDQNIKCLGVLFNSDIFEGRTSGNELSETFIFSGSTAESLSQLNDVELKKEIANIRKKLFTQLADVSQIQSLYKTYWPQGLPLYNKDLLNFQKQLQRPKNIYLHGNYVTGIGLSKIVAGSLDIAEKVKKDLL